MRKWWKEALRRKARPKVDRSRSQRRVLSFESLEDRRLLTTTLTAIQPSFVNEGPAPITNQNATTNNGLVKETTGAVQAIAIDTPVDSSGGDVYIGTVNGGIWQTTNYYSTGSGPTWTPITDQDNINIPSIAGNNGALTADPTKTTPSSGLNGSLSISALAIDKSTSLPGSLPVGSPLVAATGHYSDVGLNGTGPSAPLTGVWELLPNNGNALADGNPNTWYQVEGIPTGNNYAAVAVSSDSSSGVLTEYIMAADNGNNQYDNPRLVRSEPVGTLYEVTMTYANGVPTYTPFQASTPLPAGAVTDVIQDPATPTTFYAAVIGTNAGIFRTIDDGKDWYRIADVSTMPELQNAVNVQLAPAKNLTLYVGIVGSDFQLDNVYYSTNDNANLPPTQAINEGVLWTSMGRPSTADGGINYYLLGAINFAITADPNNSTQIYVGGDFSPPSAKTGTWPNTLGQAEDTGIVFRGNVTSKTQSSWTPLVGVDGQDTSPPAGTRELVVGPTGELLESNNGGIYDRVSPTGAGSWVSHDGLVPTTPAQSTNALSTSEFYSVAYNPLANTIIGGTQDNGVVEQGAQNGNQWSTVSVNLAGETVNPNQTFNVPVSPVGISGGQVAIDTNTPGQAILYSSNDYFSDFFEQKLSSQMTVPPAPVSPGPTMIVNGASGKTIYQVENNAGASFAAQTPIAVNNVLANALVMESVYVYESTTPNATTLGGNGNNWTAIQGLTNNNGVADPVNGIGPITALAYGGTLNGSPNPYILWAGSSGGDDLYLRAPSQASPTGQTFTTGGTATYQNPVGVLLPQSGYTGGAPVGIVMNPSNWTHTYIASGGSVTLATVTPWTGGNPNVTTSTSVFKSLGSPGISISGIVYIPLPTSVNATDDAIVVSGYAAGNPNSTGVYELLVNKVTGLADGNWTMVGVAADGVQTGVSGQKAQLPHVPVTAITYNAAADVLVVATEGRGVWTLPNFTQLANSYAMAVSDSGAVSFEGVANNPGYFNVTVNGVNDNIVAGPNTTLPANLKQFPLPLSAIQDAVTVTLTGATNSFDINFANGTPIPTIPNNPTPGFTVAGSGTTTLTIEDDAPSLTLSTTVAGSTLAMSNSSTVIGLTGITAATLTGGPGNNNFIIYGWTVPTTLTGVGGSDTLTDTTTSTSNIASVLNNTSLVQTVIGGGALATVNFTNISTANLTGGNGTSNTFDITQWTAGGGSVNGGTAGGVGNTIIDTTTVDQSYIFFSNTGISVGSPSNSTLYRPLIALANLQTINLTGVSNNHYFDIGWFGTVNVTAGLGNGNAVQTGTLQANTTFTLSNAQILVGTTSVVNMTNVQYVQLIGGAGNNTYIVSNFHLIGYLTGGGSTNTVVATEPQDFAVSNTEMLVGPSGNGSQGIFYLSGMSALNLNTVSGTHSVVIYSFSGTGTLSAGTGQDSFTLGGFGAQSSLDGLGVFNILGGGGSTLTLNDENNNAVTRYWYDMFNNQVVPDEDTPRAWGGVNYDTWVYNVTVNGTSASGGTEFLVGPSNTNSFVLYGNSPKDFLGVLFYGTPAQNFTSTPDPSNPAKQNGYWTFNTPGSTAGQMPVSFAGINSFNNVTPLVLTGASGAGNTSSPLVRVYNATTGVFQDQFLAYASTFQGGVQTAVGQFQLSNPNSYYIVTAPGPGTPDLVKVWTSTGTLVTQFYAFGPNYTGGVNVAVGDITGDGVPDIIVGAQTGNTLVGVFDGGLLNTNTPGIVAGRSFYAYPTSYTGGVSVAVASFNGGKSDDIVTVPYTAGPAQVKIFDGQSVLYDQTVQVVDSYYALPSSYTLGATLVVGNVNADGVPDIAVAAGVDGNSEIVVTDGASAMTGTSTPTTLNTFYAYPTPSTTIPSYSASTEVPLRIGMKDILGDGRMEVFTAQAAGGNTTGGMNVLMVSYPGLYLAHLSISSAANGGLTIG